MPGQRRNVKSRLWAEISLFCGDTKDRIPLVNQVSVQERLVWSFWLAAGIAFVGGLWPLIFGGTSSRIANAIIPFTIGAAALAACGFVYRQGRTVTAVLYFVAGVE